MHGNCSSTSSAMHDRQAIWQKWIPNWKSWTTFSSPSLVCSIKFSNFWALFFVCKFTSFHLIGELEAIHVLWGQPTPQTGITGDYILSVALVSMSKVSKESKKSIENAKGRGNPYSLYQVNGQMFFVHSDWALNIRIANNIFSKWRWTVNTIRSLTSQSCTRKTLSTCLVYINISIHLPRALPWISHKSFLRVFQK